MLCLILPASPKQLVGEDQLNTGYCFVVISFSDGLAINTIARAHGDGAAETAATWPGGDDGRAGAGVAGHTMDAGGLEGFGQGQRRQDGGEAVREPQGPGDHR